MIHRTDFTESLSPPWRITEIGRGTVTQSPGLLRLDMPPSPARTYSDAQITDYTARRDFLWHSPLRMTVTARAETSSPLGIQGTAGFGFWNHPFSPGERTLHFPKAAWFFFASPPNKMALAMDVPGAGWKAATIDATRPQFLALLPTAPIGFLLMRIPALYRRLWPIGQRAVGVSEHLLDTSLLFQRHTYTLDWQSDSLTFAVDGVTVHQTPSAPRGALGFVAWIDNQYAVVTPQGHFGWGLIPTDHPQSLLLEEIIIERTLNK